MATPDTPVGDISPDFGPLALQYGPWGLILGVVMSLARGWIVPRWVYLEMKRITGEQNEILRAANLALQETIDEKDRQIRILLGARNGNGSGD